MNNTRKILIIAGVVVFVIIGVLGFAIKGGHGKTPTTSSNKSTSNSNSSSSSQGTSWHKATDAIALVQSTYLTATAYIGRHTTPDQGELDSVKDSLTNELYVRMTQTLIANNATGDQVLCTTQGVNSGYDVQLLRVSGPTATVNVTEKFNIPIVVTYSVDLASLKITDIACPSS